jgi:hypothetical protein
MRGGPSHDRRRRILGNVSPQAGEPTEEQDGGERGPSVLRSAAVGAAAGAALGATAGMLGDKLGSNDEKDEKDEKDDEDEEVEDDG